MALTALDFWHLVEHIIPVYVLVIVAYALTRLDVIEPVHAPGIGKWVSFLGVPTYVFHLLAFNDPYQMSLRLVGADFLQKAIALGASCLWWKISKSGCIEGVIGFFMLATLPNTVLIGDSLLQPLYGDAIHTQVVTIIFLQSLVWYNLCICLYELRVVLLEEKHVVEHLQSEKDHDHDIIHVHNSGFISVGTSGPISGSTGQHAQGQDRELQGHGVVVNIELPPLPPNGSEQTKKKRKLAPIPGYVNQDATLERTVSAPSQFSFSRSMSFKFTPRKVWDLDYDGDDLPTSGPLELKGENSKGQPTSPAIVFNMTHSGDIERQFEKNSHDSDRYLSGDPAVIMKSPEADVAMGETDKKKSVVLSDRGFTRAVVIGLKMLNRVKRVPLTYASIAGLIYSMFAAKYHWEMPYPIRTCLELISQSAIGMALFSMGMAWARSGRLISCGWIALAYGIVVRFLIGPITMIISSVALRMEGTSLRFAILQAVIPQGVISFVLAKEYGLDIPLFNTAVVFQLVIFLPIVLAYYYVLEAI